MHGEIGGSGDGEQKGGAGALAGLGHGREDEQVGQSRGGAGHAGSQCEGVEQEAVHRQYMAGTEQREAIPSCNGSAAPPQAPARRLEEAGGRRLARVCNLRQCMGAQQVDDGEEHVGGKGMVGGVGEEREEREEQRRLVVDAAIVGGHIVGVEVEALLDCRAGQHRQRRRGACYVRLLKLDTGVDSSTRPARRSGSRGRPSACDRGPWWSVGRSAAGWH
jgi:hypothetical protein